MKVNDNAIDEQNKLSKTPIHPDIYQVTHDLRAPLMSLQGLINLLKSDVKRERFNEYIGFMENSIQKMDASISQIINPSKDQSKPEIVTQEVDFKKLIDESLFSLRFMEEAESVHINVSVQDSGLFLSDYLRLLSIFNNMISNAIRYRDRSKNSFLHIDVSFIKGRAIIVFADNGIGIAESFQSKIFNKLFRVNRDHRGTGLGLHIVRRSIKKLGGDIKLSSSLGKGTTFTIKIPNLLSSHLSVHIDQ
jgi:signal transduction histidine kinase